MAISLSNLVCALCFLPFCFNFCFYGQTTPKRRRCPLYGSNIAGGAKNTTSTTMYHVNGYSLSLSLPFQAVMAMHRCFLNQTMSPTHYGHCQKWLSEWALCPCILCLCILQYCGSCSTFCSPSDPTTYPLTMCH